MITLNEAYNMYLKHCEENKLSPMSILRYKFEVYSE